MADKVDIPMATDAALALERIVARASAMLEKGGYKFESESEKGILRLGFTGTVDYTVFVLISAEFISIFGQAPISIDPALKGEVLDKLNELSWSDAFGSYVWTDGNRRVGYKMGFPAPADVPENMLLQALSSVAQCMDKVMPLLLSWAQRATPPTAKV